MAKKIKASEFVVKVDDRENPKVIEMFTEMGINLKKQRLNVGDYVIGWACIERKTIDDLCASIIDGRIKSQSEKMLDNYKYNYIIVSGRISDRTSDIHENCILGIIASLAVRGINVICVDNEKQLGYVMKRIFERHYDLILIGEMEKDITEMTDDYKLKEVKYG